MAVPASGPTLWLSLEEMGRREYRSISGKPMTDLIKHPREADLARNTEWGAERARVAERKPSVPSRETVEGDEAPA
jgi:hypothetical protein